MKRLILYTTKNQREDTENALSSVFETNFRFLVPIATLESWEVVGYAANFAGANDDDFAKILHAIDDGAGLMCVESAETLVEEEGLFRQKTFEECLDSHGFRLYNRNEHLEDMSLDELRMEGAEQGVEYYWVKGRETLLTELLSQV